MTKQKQKSKNNIPDFASRQEMAEWWKTHDLADYADELKPVELKFNENHPNLTKYQYAS